MVRPRNSHSQCLDKNTNVYIYVHIYRERERLCEIAQENSMAINLTSLKGGGGIKCWRCSWHHNSTMICKCYL